MALLQFQEVVALAVFFQEKYSYHQLKLSLLVLAELAQQRMLVEGLMVERLALDLWFRALVAAEHLKL
jgi:hypothetical protein